MNPGIRGCRHGVKSAIVRPLVTGAWRAAFARLLFVAALAWGAPILAADIQWDDTKLLQHRSVNEPVEELLRQILSQNGLNGIFLEGVRAKEPISQEFDDVPLQAAFNKVLQENGLTYTYDEARQTVTVAVATEVQTKFRLITPEYMTLAEVEAAFERFSEAEPRLRDARPVFDPVTQSVLLRGEPDHVKELEVLIKALDDGEKRRAEARGKQLKDQLDTQKLRQQVEAGEFVVRMVPLRFAAVGETKLTFGDEQVSVPGMDETLYDLIGVRPTVVRDGEGLTPQADASGTDGSLEPLRISIDPRTNSVIVRGAPRRVDEVVQLVRQLDRPVPMVDLEVLIMQADAGVGRSLGVQWAVAEKNASGRNIFGLSTGAASGSVVGTLADNALNAGSTVNTVVGSGGNTVVNTQQSVDPITLLGLNSVANLTASFIYNGPRSFIQAQINALSSDNKAELISSPHVVTMNNVAARIESSDKLHVRIATNEGGEGDIKEIDAGLKLHITPTVIEDIDGGGDALVRMNVNAESSAFTSALATQEKQIQTQVMLRDGATFMLGGLFESRRLESENGVPGLMDIPVLGALFRNRESVDSRAETIFFITPSIIAQERIVDQHIAVRDYMHDQRRRLRADERDLRSKSGLLPLTAELREDE